MVVVERRAARVLVTFGGYNGRFTNDLNAFRVAPHALGSDGAGAVLAEAEVT